MFIRKFLLCTVLIALLSCTSSPDITRSNSAETGPWLTIAGDPATSVVVNWLTGPGRETALYFGADGESMEYLSREKKSRFHSFPLEGLEPGTLYQYKIEDAIYHFRTAGNSGENYSLAVVGDLQPWKGDTRKNNRIMAKALSRTDCDLIVQLGDIAENGGINFLWELTLDNLSSYASTRPFIAAAGNHEYYWKGKDNFRRLFPYDYPSEDELYHSLIYGSSALIFPDWHIENPDFSGEQYQWLENELKKVDERGIPWKFIFFHGTLLPAAEGTSEAALYGKLTPLLEKYDVSGVFFGHTHLYKHWLYDDIHYFLTGGGGGSLLKDEYVSDALYGEKTLHYMRLDFSGESNEICTISARYPDGSLLAGPSGDSPQIWVLKKGELR